MKSVGLALVFLILAVSCKNEEVAFVGPVFPETYCVDARILNDDFMFRHGHQPQVYDSLLIVGNMSDKDIICIFNKNTGTLIESLGQLGNGPYELITPIAFSVDQSSGYLYVNDYGRKDILKYDLTKIVKGADDYVTAVRLSEGSKERNSFLFVKDSLFISTGFDDRVALVNPSQIKDKIEACSAVLGFESPQTWNQFMSSYSCNAVSPDGKKFASATLIGGIVELYSIDGDKIKEGRKKFFYEPIFDKKGMAYNPTPQTIYGFCHLSATNTHL
ncbi:MAG: 6-bladed beta-propeller, partial [Tannerellaceae bacterium]